MASDSRWQTSGRVTRAVAVGNRIHLAAKMTEADYVAELERIAGLAAPHLATDRPNLLVLGEVLGLPAALVGRRGALARRARSSRTALSLLAVALLPRVLAYRRRWRVTLPQVLLLASADALYRPFAEALSRLARQYHTHIVATTLAPHVRRSEDPREIARWGRRGAGAVYLPRSPEVYNAALIFGPDGALLGRVDKVYLTKSEIGMLNLTPGRLEDVRVFDTAAGRLGVAISLDAFTPEYVRRLDDLGAQIVVQPDANDQQWAAPSASCDWQPAEWLNSVLGSIQPSYHNLRYNVCAMQTGSFFDLTFDGQSTITARSASSPSPRGKGVPFVGVDEWVHTVTGEPLAGEFLAASPWVADDPALADPTLTLEQRRERLREVADELLPGGKRANQYRESVIWADLPLE